MSRRGVVSFNGKTKFKGGIWISVTYDEPVGKNDGAVAGARYEILQSSSTFSSRPVEK
ncbi:unnamed protein product [Heligmosomoides polygyrus]|uniref:CAP-Gly domain-containing protein n=1 Tax=Heligmosomoides polygyrus TaxID=6339 RepID=A0A183FCF7_HELPZ|nr:unnamed protein product [Heligmosomoides polygyrus]